jgi:hypothetical protein
MEDPFFEALKRKWGEYFSLVSNLLIYKEA